MALHTQKPAAGLRQCRKCHDSAPASPTVRGLLSRRRWRLGHIFQQVGGLALQSRRMASSVLKRMVLDLLTVPVRTDRLARVPSTAAPRVRRVILRRASIMV
ncbi:hypothetical protein N008_01295 [Hymenobacter sp. APR13]|nr:hypothetical protein N008_01295 [Hymenobacter sp. APR13]